MYIKTYFWSSKAALIAAKTAWTRCYCTAITAVLLLILLPVTLVSAAETASAQTEKSPTSLLPDPTDSEATGPERVIIEVLLFAHQPSPDETGNDEIWPRNPGTPDLRDTQYITMATVDQQGVSETIIMQQHTPNYWPLKTDLKLLKTAAKLSRLSQFQPLLHVAWLQNKPQTDNRVIAGYLSNAPTIGSDEETPTADTQIADVTSQMTKHNDVTSEADVLSTTSLAANNPEYQYQGWIRLLKKRYLHIRYDLLISNPLKKAAENKLLHEGQLTKPLLNGENIRISNSKRIKYGETHYFDHPRYGLLIVINKAEPYQALPQPSKIIEEIIEPLEDTDIETLEQMINKELETLGHTTPIPQLDSTNLEIAPAISPESNAILDPAPRVPAGNIKEDVIDAPITPQQETQLLPGDPTVNSDTHLNPGTPILNNMGQNTH